MPILSIVPIIVTFIGVVSFAVLFTILYKTYTHSQIEEIKSGKRDIEIIDEVIRNRDIKVIKRKKTLKIVKTVVYYVALAIIVPIFIFSLYSKIVNNVLMIGGRNLMVVASPSMSEINEENKYVKNNKLTNQFDQYDIIYLEKIDDPSMLSQYDVICFKNDKDINIIHRIREIKFIDGQVRYVTRGDANKSDDPYSPKFEDVVGRYTGKKIDGIGIFIIFLQSGAGIITIVSLVYCLIMIDRNTEKINKVQRERAKKIGKVIDYSEETKTNTLTVKYFETIYYKGVAYVFDEQGFVEKKELETPDENKITEVAEEDSSETLVTEENLNLEETADSEKTENLKVVEDLNEKPSLEEENKEGE